MGLQAKSFDLAAEAYSEAVGGSMSSDSLQRVTEKWGKAVEVRRKAQAEQVYGDAEPERAESVPPASVIAPITKQANISTDGGMILLRQEGWKEVKLCVISEVHLKPGEPDASESTPDLRVTLKQHSYQAGLWDADDMGQHQYLEGIRRGLDGCRRLSSVNDGAVWIERITATNYPSAVQITDWGHADERLWNVAKAAFGEGTARTQQWAETYVDQLWYGRVENVVSALHALDWEHITCTDNIRSSPGYFELRQAKMDYARFRQQGLPIGSGTAESGINTVVHHRMKRQGRGWNRENGQAMLAALSELHSHRFESTWRAILASPN